LYFLLPRRLHVRFIYLKRESIYLTWNQIPLLFCSFVT